MISVIQLQLVALIVFLFALIVLLRLREKQSERTNNLTTPNSEHVVVSEVPDLRTRYPANFRADDGHFVRSNAELLIDNWLHRHRILHEYEKQIPGELMMCEFYLPDYDVYLEFWGGMTEDYEERKREKMETYRRKELKVLSVDDSDIEQLEFKLIRKLRKQGVRV